MHARAGGGGGGGRRRTNVRESLLGFDIERCQAIVRDCYTIAKSQHLVEFGLQGLEAFVGL
jgi:hypothetical protein